MKSQKSAARLRILFIAAVIVPAGLLALLAIRAINREEAYVEKQLQQTLSAELTHVASLITAELEKIREELVQSAPSTIAGDPAPLFKTWKDGVSMIRTPFLLRSDFEILWPRLTSAVTNDQIEFLKSNQEFVTNKTETPVYANIAIAYQEEIVNFAQPKFMEKTKNNLESSQKAESQQGQKESELKKPAAPGVSFEAASQRKADDSKSQDSSTVGRNDKEKTSTVYPQQQKAIKDFEENRDIRQQVYQQAKEKGQQAGGRNIEFSSNDRIQKESPRQESIFISELKRFNQIIAGKTSGIIPRFNQDKLTFLFWKKDKGDRIVGCLLDETAVRNRILGLLPALYSPARILTILDENGRPLAVPDGSGERDWRRPFVSQEISEILPRWEASAYLTDPRTLASRANLTALVMWGLILMLVVSILSSGVYILKTLRHEMDLARKKTTFVANVSHELKTPLTSIRLFAEMLKEGRPADAQKRAHYLDLMVSETDRLTRLINNVLDFSRRDKGEKTYALKALDLNRLAEELVKEQRPRLEHNGFTVVFRPAPSPLFIKADEDALKQGILNLLSNAEKYSDQVKDIEIETASAEGRAILRIKDRGIGVPPSYTEKIFKEFYRVDDSLTARTSGTGLGLSITRQIIRDHGGDIDYVPRDGGGSIFEINLPLGDPS